MEDLMAYLDSKPPTKRTVDPTAAWRELRTKLMEARKFCPIGPRIHETESIDGERILGVCIQSLQRVINKSKPPHILFPLEMKSFVDNIISMMQNTLQNSTLLSLFLRKFVTLQGACPLQLLWILQKAGFLQIAPYVCQVMKSGRESAYLTDAIFWLLTHSSQSPEYLDMGKDVLASFLVTSQGCVPGVHQDLSSCSVSLLQNFTKLIVKWVLSSTYDPSHKPVTTSHISYLSSRELQETCGQDALKWFALTHILQLFSEDVSINSMESICEAAKDQEKLSNLESCSSGLRDLLHMIITTLEVDEIIRLLGGAVRKTYINWRLIFLTTAMLISAFPNSSEHLQGLTEELLRIGLEGGRQVELSAAFLLARQCCIYRCPNFLSYANWFSCHFGPDSATARSPAQFQTLLKVLTELAPVETADTLRVHLNKVPQAPTNCNALLHDYTVLARTRLADLNESTELAGLFGNRQDNLTGLDLRMSDLYKVLEHFQRTGEIMKPVFEAAIFRPQYYRDIFLTDLLGLSDSNDRFVENEELESARHDFISTLKSLNKIPEKLLRDYIQKRHSLPSETSSSSKDNEMKTDTALKNDAKPKKKSLHIRTRKQ